MKSINNQKTYNGKYIELLILLIINVNRTPLYNPLTPSLMYIFFKADKKPLYFGTELYFLDFPSWPIKNECCQVNFTLNSNKDYF